MSGTWVMQSSGGGGNDFRTPSRTSVRSIGGMQSRAKHSAHDVIRLQCARTWSWCKQIKPKETSWGVQRNFTLKDDIKMSLRGATQHNSTRRAIMRRLQETASRGKPGLLARASKKTRALITSSTLTLSTNACAFEIHSWSNGCGWECSGGSSPANTSCEACENNHQFASWIEIESTAQYCICIPKQDGRILWSTLLLWGTHK